MTVEVDQLIEHVRRAREPRHDRRVPTPHARLRLARLGLGGRQQLPSPAAAALLVLRLTQLFRRQKFREFRRVNQMNGSALIYE